MKTEENQNDNDQELLQDKNSALRQIDKFRAEFEKDGADSFFVISAKSEDGRIVDCSQYSFGGVSLYDWVTALEISKSVLIDDIKNNTHGRQRMIASMLEDMHAKETYLGECSDAPNAEIESTPRL